MNYVEFEGVTMQRHLNKQLLDQDQLTTDFKLLKI